MRVSADRNDIGFRDDYMYWSDITLDGKPVWHVITFDEEAGTILRYKTDPRDLAEERVRRLLTNEDNFVTETIRGVVVGRSTNLEITDMYTRHIMAIAKERRQ